MIKYIFIFLVSINCFSQTNDSEIFETFFTQFKKSKSFQFERTLFPIKVVYGEYISESGKTETIFISKSKWEFSDFSTSKNKNLLITQKSKLPNYHTVICQIQDTGFYMKYLFKKHLGKWFLYEIRDEST